MYANRWRNQHIRQQRKKSAYRLTDEEICIYANKGRNQHIRQQMKKSAYTPTKEEISIYSNRWRNRHIRQPMKKSAYTPIHDHSFNSLLFGCGRVQLCHVIIWFGLHLWIFWIWVAIKGCSFAKNSKYKEISIYANIERNQHVRQQRNKSAYRPTDAKIGIYTNRWRNRHIRQQKKKSAYTRTDEEIGIYANKG